MDKKYLIKIDDNFHSMDGSVPSPVGSRDTLEEAIEACKRISIESLKSFYEKGITPDEMIKQWCLFGDDPFIQAPADSDVKVPFSARSFITIEMCENIIKEKEEAEKK